jgi:hypothetical protein
MQPIQSSRGPKNLVMFLAVLLAMTKSTPAFSETPSDTTNACVQAYAGAQAHRKNEDLLAARDALRLCSARACPTLIQNDCNTWLAEVVEAIPSIVLAARVNEDDVFDVSVSMDGARLAGELDGKPIEVNPGLHTFVFERGGNLPIQKKVIVAAHQRSQTIAVEWKRRAAGPAAPSGPAVETHDARPTATRPVPPAVYILGATAVVGLATFAILGLGGRATQNDLETSCAPRCAKSDVDALQTRYLVANIGAVVGGLSAAGAVILFLVRPAHDPGAARLSLAVDIQPVNGGATASLRTPF